MSAKSTLADTAPSDCGIAVDTARRWVAVLVTSFLVFLLPPHYRSFQKPVITSPKLCFFDTGLTCHVLDARSASQLDTHPLRGALFENLVIAEVAKAYWHHRRTPPTSFWRDQTGHGIDLLVEERREAVSGRDQGGATFASDMLTPLRWWSGLAAADAGQATLAHAGGEFLTHTGIHIRPWWSV